MISEIDFDRCNDADYQIQGRLNSICEDNIVSLKLLMIKNISSA
jgi:hypothetical protein